MKGLQSEIKSYEDRIKAIDKEIELVGGEAIQKRRRELKATADQHASMQKEISSTKVKLRATHKAIKQLEEENIRLAKDVSDAEQAIQAAKTQFELIEKEAAQLLAAFELAQKSQAGKQKEMDAATTAYERLKKENGETEVALGTLEECCAGLAKQLEELEKQREIWVKKIETLRKKTWENTRELDDQDDPVLAEGHMEEESQENEEEESRENGMEEEHRENGMEEETLRSDPAYRIIRDVSSERLASIDKTRIERNILRLEAEKDNLKKNVNLSAISE